MTVSESLSGITHLSVIIRLSGITSVVTRGLPSFRIFGNVFCPQPSPTQPSLTRWSTQPMDNSAVTADIYGQ